MVLMMILNALLFPRMMATRVKEVNYSSFISMVQEDQVTEVVMTDDEIDFSAKDADGKERWYKTGVFPDENLEDVLEEHGVEFGTTIPKQNSPLLNFFLTWVLPFLLFSALGQFMMKRMSQSIGGSVGKNSKGTSKGIEAQFSFSEGWEWSHTETRDINDVDIINVSRFSPCSR